MKTTEGTKLIAEFMGFQPLNGERDSYGYDPKDFTNFFPNYDKSWNWLMPVVERAHNPANLVKSIRFFEVPSYAEQNKRLIPKFY